MYQTDCYGKLCGSPTQKRIYDWLRMAYITVVIVDVGRAYGIQTPATKYDDPAWKPSKKIGRPDTSMARVEDWLRSHGPSTAKDISDGMGMDNSTIHGVLSRGEGRFVAKIIYAPRGNGSLGKVRLWEVAK